MSGITPAPLAARIMNASRLMTWQDVMDLPTPLTVSGRSYRVTIEGQERPDGTWAGRIRFSNGAAVRHTGQETSQPNRTAVEYWATGLEPVYLEGAFGRSRGDLEVAK